MVFLGSYQFFFFCNIFYLTCCQTSNLNILSAIDSELSVWHQSWTFCQTSILNFLSNINSQVSGLMIMPAVSFVFVWSVKFAMYHWFFEKFLMKLSLIWNNRFTSDLYSVASQTIWCGIRSKFGNLSQGWPKGSLFNSYYTKMLGRVLLHSLDCSTLPLMRTL